MVSRDNGGGFTTGHVAARRGRFRFHVPDRADPWTAGAAATLVSMLLSWRPSFWFDEAATVAAANRSEVDILRLVLNFDAVHGLYYLAMHAWFSGSDQRVHGATSKCSGSGRRCCRSRRVGQAGGRTPHRMGCGGCIYRAATHALVGGRGQVVCADRRGRGVADGGARHRRHATRVCAVGFVRPCARAGHVCFVYLALLVFAHAVTLALSRKRRQLLPFAIAVAVGLSLASPLIALTAGQRQHQLWWINEGGYLTGVFWEQWLTGSRLFLCASVILLVWGSVVLVTRKVSAGEALAVAVRWVVVPTALLVGYSVLVSDIYHPRYLTYTGPGLGLLLGFALRPLRGTDRESWRCCWRCSRSVQALRS